MFSTFFLTHAHASLLQVHEEGGRRLRGGLLCLVPKREMGQKEGLTQPYLSTAPKANCGEDVVARIQTCTKTSDTLVLAVIGSDWKLGSSMVQYGFHYTRSHKGVLNGSL